MNGDSLPDYVVTGIGDTSPWSVYLNTGVGFSTSSVDFGMMGPIRRQYVGSFGTANPDETSQDLFDFNGDGLPDIVSNADYQAPNPFNPAVGVSRTRQTILDASGNVVQYVHIDDLLCSEDQVCPGLIPPGGGLIDTLEVFLNNGHGFEPAVFSPLPKLSESEPPYWGGYLRYADDQGDVLQDFLDVTGDGLPDLVTTESGGATWRVSVNVGSGRLSDDALEIPAGGNASAARSPMVLAGASGPIRDMRSSGTLQRGEMQDWNGDGLPDQVVGGNGAWTMRPMESSAGPGATTRPWLLELARDGVGGVFEVEYVSSGIFPHTGGDAVPDLPFPLWVVGATRQTDGTCTPPVGIDVFDPGSNPCIEAGNERVRYFEYANGAYDAPTRQFRGFGEVTEIDVFGNRVVNAYYQDEHRRGRLLRSEVRTAGDEHIVRSTSNVWLTQPSALSDGRTQVYLAESVTETSDLLPEGSSGAVCLVNRNRPPDAWGRVSHACSLSCASDPGMSSAGDDACDGAPIGQVDTMTEWANPQSASHFVRERPRRVRTEYIAVDGSRQTLSDQSFYYDGVLGDRDSAAGFGTTTFGLVKRIESEVGSSHLGSGLKSITKTAYDDIGNAIEMEDPSGLVSTVSFDPQFALYPSNRITYIAGVPTYSSATVYDLRFGKIIANIDLNGRVTSYEYDVRGRLICETLPGDDPAHCHDSGWPFSRTIEYHYVDGVQGGVYPASLSFVETRRRHPDASGGFLVSRQYVDGLGRAHFNMSERIVESDTIPSTIIAGHVRFDAAGRVEHQYPPYVLVGGAVSAFPPGVPTTTTYLLNGTALVNPLGRVGVVDPPDATRQTFVYAGRTTTTRNARNDTAIEVVDDFGRVIRRESGVGSTNPAVSSFTHDGMGRVLTETFGDDASTEIENFYDLLGRRITTVDPDSGTWKFGFDPIGSLVFRDTPAANQSIYMCHDAMHRIEKRCVRSIADAYDSTVCSSGCQNTEIESQYTYDETANGSFGIGRLSSVVDESGSASFRYDARGRVVYESKTILDRTATFEYGFTSAGQLDWIEYPDGEIVSYHYRGDGSIASVDSVDATYASSLQFDLHGRASRLERGNGVVDEIDYFDELDGSRLQSVSVSSLGVPTPHLSLAYQYDNLGKLAQVIDARNASGALSNDAIYAYDSAGRLESQTGTAGALYDFSYVYDSLGNLTQNGSTSIAYDSARPHQIQSIDGIAVAYDANGNRKTRGAHPTTGAAESYVYDALNRMIAVHDAGVVSHATFFMYDFQGRLVADVTWENFSETPNAFYYSSLARAEAGDLIKGIFAGDLLIAERPVWAPEFSTGVTGVPEPVIVSLIVSGFLGLLMLVGFAGGPLNLGRKRLVSGAIGTALLYFVGLGAPFVVLATPAGAQQQGSGPDRITHLHFDHLGSTQAITDSTGQLTHQVRYDPYGRVRGRFDGSGGSVAAGVGTRQEFAGYTTDVGSGLQVAGLRVFDPLTGQFLQGDPAEEFASPYSYGPGDPINGTDPTGASWEAIVFLVGLALVVANSIYVGVTTGSAVQAFTAFSAGVMQLFFAAAIVSPAVSYVVHGNQQSSGRLRRTDCVDRIRVIWDGGCGGVGERDRSDFLRREHGVGGFRRGAFGLAKLE